jgi:hypothetical protein
MSDYHINTFYSEEDTGYIADIPISIPVPHSETRPTSRWPNWSLQRMLA